MAFLSELPVDTLIFITAIVALALHFHIRYTPFSALHGPTILTTTGILATFVGIAIGLHDVDPEKISNTVPVLLGGLKTAFYASIVGVAGALTLKLRQLAFGDPKRVQSLDIQSNVTANDLANILTGIRRALVGDDEGSLVTQMKLARQDSNDRLDSLRQAQVEALQKLSELGSKALIEALKDVIRDFNQNLTEQFGENFKALNSAVEKLVLWQNDYRHQMEETTSNLRLVTQSMGDAADSYATLVNKSEGFVAVAKDLSTLIQALEAQRTELGGALRMLGDLLVAASGSLPQIEKKVIELTDQMTRAVTHNQGELSKALTENTAQIKASTEASGRDLAKLNAEMSKEISAIIGKTKEQITLLDKALAEELTKSLQGLGRQLAALSEKFVSDYGPLTDRLRDLVQVSRASR